MVLFTTIGVGEQTAVTDASIYVGLTPLREGTEFQRILQHLGLWKLLGQPPLQERDFSQADVMRDARKVMADYPELTSSVQNLFASGQTGSRRRPFQLILRGPDLEGLDRYSQVLAAQARTVPGMLDVDTTLARRKPEIRVLIDRDKAADLGVGVDSIASSLRTMVGGEEVTRYKEADDQYVVRLRLQDDFRKNAQVISELYVPSSKRGRVPMNNVVRAAVIVQVQAGSAPGRPRTPARRLGQGTAPRRRSSPAAVALGQVHGSRPTRRAVPPRP